jgi:hypothetical protein
MNATNRTAAQPVPVMTPEQRRRNRILGLVLLVFVVAIFAWAMFKGGSLFASGG